MDPLEKSGDIVWLNFTPQSGHEQAGLRPALVLSPSAYNRKTNLAVCCPMTTQIKNCGIRAICGEGLFSYRLAGSSTVNSLRNLTMSCKGQAERCRSIGNFLVPG